MISDFIESDEMEVVFLFFDFNAERQGRNHYNGASTRVPCNLDIV